MGTPLLNTRDPPELGILWSLKNSEENWSNQKGIPYRSKFDVLETKENKKKMRSEGLVITPSLSLPSSNARDTDAGNATVLATMETEELVESDFYIPDMDR